MGGDSVEPTFERSEANAVSFFPVARDARRDSGETAQVNELTRVLLLVSWSHKVSDVTQQAHSNKNEEQRDCKIIPVAEEPNRDDNPREEYP